MRTPWVLTLALLLAAAGGPTARAGDLVGIWVRTTDLAGNPISKVNVGREFLLQVYAEDLRSDPLGVFALTVDVLYDSARVSLSGPVTATPLWRWPWHGDASTPGVLDEFSTWRQDPGDPYAFPGPQGPGPFLVWSVPCRADVLGVATFNADPSDQLPPLSDILLFDSDEAVNVSDVVFGSTTLEIVNDPSVYIFYNQSAWDDGNGAANEADDNAIATDKVPLRHGMKATFANYTSYSRGINGLIIDIPALGGTPTVDDFLFRTGNNNKPYGDDLDDPGDDWPWAPDPTSVTVRPGAGRDGADRVTLIWPNGAIRKCWLQVTVLATDATGLARNEVFYVGNAVGDSGNSTTNTQVTVADALRVRANPRTASDNPAPIDFFVDYNRDKNVNIQDELIVRGNPTSLETDLDLIDLTALGGQ